MLDGWMVEVVGGRARGRPRTHVRLTLDYERPVVRLSVGERHHVSRAECFTRTCRH